MRGSGIKESARLILILLLLVTELAIEGLMKESLSEQLLGVMEVASQLHLILVEFVANNQYLIYSLEEFLSEQLKVYPLLSTPLVELMVILLPIEVRLPI